MSYTTFEYSNLKVTPCADGQSFQVDVTVKNTGKREGKEVVQLYLNDVVSSVTTPVKALRKFKKVNLAPGKARTISFTLEPRDLALWNRSMQLTVEPGEFKAMIGRSAEDIVLTESFSVSLPINVY